MVELPRPDSGASAVLDSDCVVTCITSHIDACGGLFVFSYRTCSRWSMAPILTRPWKRLFVNSLPDWRSCCQFPISSRYRPYAWLKAWDQYRPETQSSRCGSSVQTASWISGAPSVLEEYMQCVSNGDDLKFLLQSKQCHGKLAKSTDGTFAPQSDERSVLQDGDG